MRRFLILSFALAAVAGAPRLAGAQQSGPWRIDTTVTLARGGTVDLSLITGDITVSAGGGDQVRVRGLSERVPFVFERSASSVRVRLESRNCRRGDRDRYGECGDGEERLEVTVPTGTRVIGASVSGTVRVRGVNGEIEAKSVSGDVEVEGATRRAVLQSVSGDVSGRSLQGEVRAQSVSGDVELQSVTGPVDAESVSGDVTLRGMRSDRVEVETVSGEVLYDGSFARDGRYDFKSHSGDVRLVMPADVSASLEARTFSGEIDSDFTMTLRPGSESGGHRNRRMSFTLGEGGARITAETFSGTINLQRAGARSNRE
jgi:DUF4097 and DUF4098 domain-containing protein YvlB